MDWRNTFRTKTGFNPGVYDWGHRMWGYGGLTYHASIASLALRMVTVYSTIALLQMMAILLENKECLEFMILAKYILPIISAFRPSVRQSVHPSVQEFNNYLHWLPKLAKQNRGYSTEVNNDWASILQGDSFTGSVYILHFHWLFGINGHPNFLCHFWQVEQALFFPTLPLLALVCPFHIFYWPQIKLCWLAGF